MSVTRICGCVVSWAAPLLVVLVGLAAPGPAVSQATGSVTGHVREAETAEPVEGAAISVEALDETTLTDELGYFRLNGLETGPHILVVSYLGLETREVAFEIYAGELEEMSLTLEVRAVPVEELVVTVEERMPVSKLLGFHRRMEQGPGYYITREEIVERNSARPSDLLRRVPGIDVGPSRFGSAQVTMGRRAGCVPEFYVDGARAPQFNIDNLTTGDLAGIEIYRGNSEVPIEFKAYDRCGAIIIWTRDPARGGG